MAQDLRHDTQSSNRREAAALILRAMELLVGSGDPWVPHTRWPWPKRVALRKARELGARKDGRTYYLKQTQIDAAMESAEPRIDCGDQMAAATARAARRAR